MVADQFRPWVDLPRDILSCIADRLPIISLLSFRGTCKDFRSASSTASAQIESCRSPWLLFNKIDSPECLIYNEHESQAYKRNIEDLEGTICLASYKGWLLLFKEGSIFFFSPFSLAKIALPDFPHKKFNGHVGSFSDLPSSPHCIVSVVNQIDKEFVELHLLFRGQTVWTNHRVRYSLRSTFSARTFVHKDQTFYYLDGRESLLTFSVKDKKSEGRVIKATTEKSDNCFPYWFEDPMFCDEIENKRHQLDLKDDEYVVLCGITNEHEECGQLVYLNEVEDVSPTKTRIRRAVWIQPRFYEANPEILW